MKFKKNEKNLNEMLIWNTIKTCYTKYEVLTKKGKFN